jgi:hypothetical protein
MPESSAESSPFSWFSKLFKPSSVPLAQGEGMSAREVGAGGPNPDQSFFEKMKSFGLTVLHGMEAAGEVIVDFLGLDESLYQDVYDNMTDEEMTYATEVNRKRNEENAMLEARNGGPNLESMEGGGDGVGLGEVTLSLNLKQAEYAILKQPSSS